MARNTQNPPEEKKEPTIGDVLTVLQGMNDRISKLEEPKAPEQSTEPTVSAPKPEDKPKSDIPVPAEWKEAVKSVLNERFQVEVDYNADTPTFAFSILVPQEYSNAGKNHWELYKEDRRTRVINNSDGASGVKQWVEKVYNNFDNETKAKITSDRALT